MESCFWRGAQVGMISMSRNSLRTAEIIQTDPHWQLFRDGCPGGETPAQVADRADGVRERIGSTGGNILIFSSGHFLRVLAMRWLGLEIYSGRLFELNAASVSVLHYDHDRRESSVRLWNDSRHVAADMRMAAL